MKQTLLLLLVLAAVTTPLFSEVIPKEGSKVHYTTIYFEEAFHNKAVFYRIEIQEGKQFSEKNPMLFSSVSPYPAFHVSVFDWSKSYTWRIVPLTKKKRTIDAPVSVHHFQTVSKTNEVFFDSTELKVRVNKNEGHAGGFIAIDYLRGIYNREGKPVWIVPTSDSLINTGTEIRDIKLTEENTLTLFAANLPYEINFQGKILWSLPYPFVLEGDTLKFHHEFQKSDGSYYVLANRTTLRPILTGYEEGKHQMVREVIFKNGKPFARTDIAVVLQFDKQKKLLWKWDAGNYIKDEDLNYKKAPDNFPQLQSHANGLGIDEKNQVIYISFRDLGRIIKVDKRSGTVLASFGQKYPSGEAGMAVNEFRQQHDGRPTNHSTFLVFNNNGPRENAGVSSLLEFNQDDGGMNFKFPLDFDSLTNGKSASGGNVNELPNGNILVCAGQLNRIFEVTRQKEIVWDAFSRSVSKGDSVWKPMPNYRCSWIKNVPQPNVLLNNVTVVVTDSTLTTNVEVINVGTTSDTFILKIHEADGSVISEKKLGTIEAGKKTQADTNVKYNGPRQAGRYLTVGSLTNWSSVKMVSLE